MSRRAVTLACASCLLLVLAVVGALLPVPYVALYPGPTANTLGDNGKGVPLVQIDGRQTYPADGHLNFTTVTYRGGPEARIDLFTALRGWLSADTAIVPEETIFPKHESQQQVDAENTRQMQDSQENAEAAALHELGIAVPTRVVVNSVQPNMPASGKIQPNDEITSVNGVQTGTVDKVKAETGRIGVGGKAEIGLLRAGKPVRVTLTTAKGQDGKPVVGVVLAEAYRFPFKINISVGDIGGPSAGLMFSLSIVDKLTPGSLTGGKFVAGTGTISPEGQVGPIGGIQQKMIAARRAGATVFLTPKDNCAEALSARPSGLRLVRADTLHGAVQSLNALTSGKGDVPACSK
ncbi:PDZ domain-containing protein [Actinomadura logoneensis]|uniref:endopeptidase La n=1 Tax=Actinomadura logoneensis TaxID=2293572 RepID=A0A372JQ42_9ACTN|nr:PDZ domain-containing protein [Actinomadura logoneensis]RFU42155.1 PDZ domain-containing protein [Actinomadura logoneensis]